MMPRKPILFGLVIATARVPCLHVFALVEMEGDRSSGLKPTCEGVRKHRAVSCKSDPWPHGASLVQRTFAL